MSAVPTNNWQSAYWLQREREEEEEEEGGRERERR